MFRAGGIQRAGAAALFRTTLPCPKRFVPPWERDGKTAEDYFGGVLTTKNPIQSSRRQSEREQRQHDDSLVEDALPPEELRRFEDMEAHNASVMAQRQSFLPYGATPKKYFDESGMAAWGEYESALSRSTKAATGDGEEDTTAEDDGAYSAQTRQQLLNDMNDKIPYRFISYIPPKSAKALRWPLHGTAGLVMDIDGVIYRSKKLIPGADTAVQILQNLKIPFLFMTNGGGKTEAEKAEELSRILGTEILPDQVQLAHTPMRLLTELYRREPVLIVGPPQCAEVAKAYGFERAKSILQFQCEHPETVPFKRWDAGLKCAEPGTVPFTDLAAVLQFTDPQDGLNDVQTLLDVLTAPFGRVGSYISGTQTLPYYISGDDLLWATEAALPRLGQGAFREMMASVFESVTGQGLEITMYGKPRAIAYAYAEQQLRRQSERLGWDPNTMRSIFMIGDNIETDILGANAAGGLWTSVHVLTGIGKAPAARRTLSEGDREHEWLEASVSKLPHYVVPSFDHFVRELLAFPEDAVLQNKMPYYGKPNPVDLEETYLFRK